MKRVKVTPVVSQTSSKTGALVLDRAIEGLSTVEDLRAVTPRFPAVRELNPLTGEIAKKIAQMENFIVAFLLVIRLNK